MKKEPLFYGYIVAAASLCVMAVTWGANRTFGIVLGPMLAEFSWTRAEISGAVTLNMIVMGTMALVAGRLTDRYGPRAIIMIGALFSGLSYIFASRITSLWQLYLFYGIISGIGLSSAWAPPMSVISRWFWKRKALMSGIVIAGPALGIAIIPLLFSSLMATWGWRFSYVILGLFVIVTVAAAAFFLRGSPGEIGLFPYGADPTDSNCNDLQTEGISLMESSRTLAFWLLLLISFCNEVLVGVITVHIVIHATGLGIPMTAAAGVLSAAAGVSIPGRIIMGGVADRIGHKPALIICFGTSVIAFLLLLSTDALWMLYLFAVLFGGGLWTAGSIRAPLIADLFGLKSHGTIFACTVLASAIGGAVGPIIAGLLFDIYGSYQITFIMCIGISLIGIIATIPLQPFRQDNGMSITNCPTLSDSAER